MSLNKLSEQNQAGTLTSLAVIEEWTLLARTFSLAFWTRRVTGHAAVTRMLVGKNIRALVVICE